MGNGPRRTSSGMWATFSWLILPNHLDIGGEFGKRRESLEGGDRAHEGRHHPNRQGCPRSVHPVARGLVRELQQCGGLDPEQVPGRHES